MNNLIYVGGGMMWFYYWIMLAELREYELSFVGAMLLSLSIISVWIWICWRVIK